MRKKENPTYLLQVGKKHGILIKTNISIPQSKDIELCICTSVQTISPSRGSCKSGIDAMQKPILNRTKNISKPIPFGNKIGKKGVSEMTRHFIIMSSSYSMGTRIAYDITDPALWNSAAISEKLNAIKAVCGSDVPLSTHVVEAEDASWAAVQRYDPFFETVLCIDSLEQFAETIDKDRTLTGRDVAVYILSLVPCTHLSLEKLTYFAYAEYLCDTGKKLFADSIYAFRYGPVVESVYERYKKNGCDTIQPDTVIKQDVAESPARSRILFARDGLEKCTTCLLYTSPSPRD